MAKKIVIVGEAPSKSSDPALPFSGASGKTLAKVAGLSGYTELTYEATIVNVLQRWPGVGHSGERGSRFPIVRARRAAKRLTFEAKQVVLLAGKRVAAALAIDFTDYFHWKLLPRGVDGALVWFVLVPHPSGCNAWWNYPENRAIARRFFRQVFGTATTEDLERGSVEA